MQLFQRLRSFWKEYMYTLSSQSQRQTNANDIKKNLYSLTILHPTVYADFSYPWATKCTPYGKHRDKVYHGKKKRLCASEKTQ